MKIKKFPKQIQVSKSGKRSEVSKLNDGAAYEMPEGTEGVTYYEVDGKKYLQAYARIFIRHRKPENKEA